MNLKLFLMIVQQTNLPQLTQTLQLRIEEFVNREDVASVERQVMIVATIQMQQIHRLKIKTHSKYNQGMLLTTVQAHQFLLQGMHNNVPM